MSAMLKIEGVYTTYDKTDVLQGVSLTVGAGSITCLLGANGSGKTTLVRSILGLTPPRAGRIVFDGTDISRLPTHRIIAAGIACIPEGRRVFPRLSVEENLRLGAYQERSDAVIRTRMEEIFGIFPRLAERRTQLAGTMSGGEQAMVSIGRGLMRAPKLLLIDEPSLGLSPRLVMENFNIIRAINNRGITVFLVEQNVRQTLALAQHGYALSKGKVVAAGTSAELAERPEGPTSARVCDDAGKEIVESIDRTTRGSARSRFASSISGEIPASAKSLPGPGARPAGAQAVVSDKR